MEETKRRRGVLVANGILCGLLIVSLIVLESKKKFPDMYTLWQNIVLSVLCSVVASFIFLYIQRGIEKDYSDVIIEKLTSVDGKLKIQGELYDSGIKSIRKKSHYDKRDDFWKKIIRNADSRMDMIGHSLSHWLTDEYREIFFDKIVDMLNTNKQVRLVLSCEKKEFNLQKVQNAVAGSANKDLTKIEKTYCELVKLLKKVEAKKRKNLEVYIAKKAKISYLYIRTDNQCFISPYIHSPTNSQNSFLLELETGVEYSKCFEDDFNEMIGQLKCLKWE